MGLYHNYIQYYIWAFLSSLYYSFIVGKIDQLFTSYLSDNQESNS